MAIVPQNPGMMNNVAPQQKPKKGSGFTNLQSVLNANKNNRLGGAVVGGVQKAGSEAQGMLQQGQEKFEQGLGSARQERQGKEQFTNDVLNRFGQEGYEGQDIGEKEQQGFADLRSAKYAGPQGLSNAQQVQQKAGEAEQLGQFAGTRTGRQELLRRFVGGVPQYSAQKQMQDELLLSLGGGEGALKQAKSATKGLTSKTGQEIEKARFAGMDEAKQLESAKMKMAAGLESTMTPIEQKLAAKMKEREAEQAWRQGAVGEIQRLISAGDIKGAMRYGQEKGVLRGNQAEILDALSGYGAEALGGNKQFASSTSPQELAQLFDFGKIATSRNIAGKDIRGKLNALSRLAGKQEEFKGEQEKDVATSVNKNLANILAQRQMSEISNPEKEAELNKAAELVREQEGIYQRSLKDKLRNMILRSTLHGNPATMADVDKRGVPTKSISFEDAAARALQRDSKFGQIMGKYGITNAADFSDTNKMSKAASELFSEGSADEQYATEGLGANVDKEGFYDMYKDVGNLKRYQQEKSQYQNEVQNRHNRKLALQRILSGQYE